MNSTNDLVRASLLLQKFVGGNLTATLAGIEASLKGVTLRECSQVISGSQANVDVLAAAGLMKRAAGQISVMIHAIGICLCLPHLLKPGETIEYASLGAGNTGRLFDLETTDRVAEFKFIHWRGGSEAIRQNSLFKDFYLLAEHETPKQKYLYVLDTTYPLKFLNGGRALSSVLSRNTRLWNRFSAKHGTQFQTVQDYYLKHKDFVAIEDISAFVPELLFDPPEADL